ncbi:hypothetical protein GCM10023226_21760 [Nocardioides nanhaiensis]|uniref:CHAT domain-containing protein n=2 Tax=Nocardioides nanhaiensis TaxID=1476871 RepID=A0ABP8W8A4_9ACTN
MTAGLCDECTRRRDNWFTAVSNAIVGRIVDDPLLQALLRMTTGVGHRHGLRDEELAINGQSVDEVRKEVTRWRTGRVEPRTAWLSDITWISLRQYGQTSQRVNAAVLDEIAHGPAARMPHLHRDPLTPPPACAHDDDLYESTPAGVLSFGDNHLAIVRQHVDADITAALTAFTPLELLHSEDDVPGDLAADEVLSKCGARIDVPLAGRGGWSGSCPDGITEFQREWILNRGARNMHQTSGAVPGWFITAESLDDVNALKRLKYAGAFSFEEQPDRFDLNLHPPGPDGRPSNLRIGFGHGIEATSLLRLAIIATMRSILVDVLFLDHRFHLQHVASFSIKVPEGVAEAAAAFAKRHARPDGVIDFFAEALEADEEAALRAGAAEMRRHDVARFVRAASEGRVPRRVRGVIRRYLEALERYAALEGKYLGLDWSSSAELEETRLALREAVAGTGLHLPVIDQVTLAVLGDRRAFVHLECDTDAVLYPVVSWLDENQTPQFKGFPCGIWGSPASKPPSADAAENAESERDEVASLAAALRPLKHLLDLGITRLVVCPSERFTRTPVHVALLTLGFDEVSYAPSLALLQPTNPTTAPGPRPPHINGWAGTGKDHLPGVAAEIAIVADLYSSAADNALPASGRYPLIHLAGHATTGSSEASTGIQLQGGTLTGADVLAGLNIAGTKLVVLAACGTGHSRYEPTQLLEQTPLDSCFITVGATVCIATTRPVSDRIAVIFSTALHHALVQGTALWDAYTHACIAARNPDRRRLPSTATQVLDRTSLGWDTAPLTPIEVNDWMTFKMSGAHWHVATPL